MTNPDQLPHINKDEINKLRESRESDYKEFTNKINSIEKSVTHSMTVGFDEVKAILAANKGLLLEEISNVRKDAASKSDFHKIRDVQQEHTNRITTLEITCPTLTSGEKQSVTKITGWPAVFMNPYFLATIFVVMTVALIALIILTRNPLTLDQIKHVIEASKN